MTDINCVVFKVGAAAPSWVTINKTRAVVDLERELSANEVGVYAIGDKLALYYARYPTSTLPPNKLLAERTHLELNGDVILVGHVPGQTGTDSYTSVSTDDLNALHELVEEDLVCRKQYEASVYNVSGF